MKTPTVFCRVVFLNLLWMVAAPTAQAGCLIPKEYDVKELAYELERIDASLNIRLLFPQLSTLPCEEEKVSFGTLWTFDLPVTSAVQLKSIDRRGMVVQERSLTGKLQLKVTPTWTALYFFSLVWDKSLADQNLIKSELWNTSGLLPAPFIEISDGNVSRRVSAKFSVF